MMKSDVPVLYKTKYCKKYMQNGYCPYGVRCQFIHGVKENKCQPSACSAETSPARGHSEENLIARGEIMSLQEPFIKTNSKKNTPKKAKSPRAYKDSSSDGDSLCYNIISNSLNEQMASKSNLIFNIFYRKRQNSRCRL